MIPACHYCHAHHCLQSCPGPLPSQRPGAEYDSTPALLPAAARAAQRDACLTALRELEQECRSSAPAPITLRELASCVARACPQECVTLVPAILELTEGLAGLVRCEKRFRARYVGADHYALVRHEIALQLREAAQELRASLDRCPCGPGGGPGG